MTPSDDDLRAEIRAEALDRKLARLGYPARRSRHPARRTRPTPQPPAEARSRHWIIRPGIGRISHIGNTPV
jgi:hypothetical protein